MNALSLFRRAASGLGLGRLRRRLAGPRTAAAVWGERAGENGGGPARHWTELPIVRAEINRRVSGDPAVDPYGHFLRTHLAGRLPVARALTVGCGAGELERGLAALGFTRHHDAFDVAPRAVELAAARAEAAGFRHVRYRAADADALVLPERAYDVVLVVHSIHHVARLEHLLGEVARALKPDGFLFLDEFVGPTRFQWTDRQLEVVNGLLRCLPETLRAAYPDGRPKHRVSRPSVAEVVATDPSEAVRSAEILGVVSSLFEVVEVRPYGGTVLQLLLDDIAAAFIAAEGAADGLLAALCALEWALVSSGELPSDFAVVVARPRG